MPWDEDDRFGRWLQGICAVLLAIFSVIGGYIVLTHIGFFLLIGGIPLIYGSTRLCWRCAHYAITGRNNVNRDSF
jgi:hypothetical protein